MFSFYLVNFHYLKTQIQRDSSLSIYNTKVHNPSHCSTGA